MSPLPPKPPGFDKNELVQASCHGKNNDAMVDCLNRSNGKARGVAIVDPAISDEELQALDKAGVWGVRFNFLKRLADQTPKFEYLKIQKRVAKIGWHVLLHELRTLTHCFYFFLNKSSFFY